MYCWERKKERKKKKTKKKLHRHTLDMTEHASMLGQVYVIVLYNYIKLHFPKKKKKKKRKKERKKKIRSK